jgi:hypothetical protein
VRIDSHSMPLSAGTKLGPYEILASIGKGGMGESDELPYVVMELLDGQTLRETAPCPAERKQSNMVQRAYALVPR